MFINQQFFFQELLGASPSPYSDTHHNTFLKYLREMDLELQKDQRSKVSSLIGYQQILVVKQTGWSIKSRSENRMAGTLTDSTLSTLAILMIALAWVMRRDNQINATN